MSEKSGLHPASTKMAPALFFFLPNRLHHRVIHRRFGAVKPCHHIFVYLPQGLKIRLQLPARFTIRRLRAVLGLNGGILRQHSVFTPPGTVFQQGAAQLKGAECRRTGKQGRQAGGHPFFHARHTPSAALHAPHSAIILRPAGRKRAKPHRHAFTLCGISFLCAGFYNNFLVM